MEVRQSGGAGGLAPGAGEGGGAGGEVVEEALFTAGEGVVVGAAEFVAVLVEGLAVLGGLDEGEPGAFGGFAGGGEFLLKAGEAVVEDVTVEVEAAEVVGLGALAEAELVFLGQVLELTAGGGEVALGGFDGLQLAGVVALGLLFPLLAEGEDGLEGEAKGLHGVGRGARGGGFGGGARAAARAAQLASREKPWSTGWRRKWRRGSWRRMASSMTGLLPAG